MRLAIEQSWNVIADVRKEIDGANALLASAAPVALRICPLANDSVGLNRLVDGSDDELAVYLDAVGDAKLK